MTTTTPPRAADLFARLAASEAPISPDELQTLRDALGLDDGLRATLRAGLRHLEALDWLHGLRSGEDATGRP
jgi:hypothetical protein